MADPVGLSIGTTNLVAARVGSQPVTRRSVLTLYGDQPSEVGLPGAESGLVLRGFVERVGDPVPLVAVDGSTHLADRLLVDALGAMADTVGASSDVAIAVPAYWNGTTIRTLSDALSRDRKLAPTGVPPRLVSDAAAALVALQNESELTSDGLLVLLDFGGSGTSITLVDAEHGFEPVAETVRHVDFSGDLIDQELMSKVVAEATGTEDADPAATAAVGSLARLRDECRQAKERLSTEYATTLSVDLPGYTREISLTRTELEAMIAEPLDGVLDAAQDLLRRSGRSWSEVMTVAAVGGGASIPAVAQRLSEEGGARVLTTAHPGRDAAIGAALVAARGPDADAPTGIGTAVADANTSGIDGLQQPVGAVGAALAWSQDDDRTPEPVAYTEANPYAGDRTAGRPRVEYIPPTGPIQSKAPEPVARRLPKYAVGAAGLIALFAAGGVVYSLTATSTPSAPSTPTPSVATETPAAPPPTPPPTTEAPPPPPPPTTEAPAPAPPETTYVPPPPPPETVTRTVTPTTTAPPVTTTTTTPPPTTTTTTTTTTATTTVPTTTTTSPVTLPTPAMTTTYLTVPFIPVPIPIQVPQPPTSHLQ